ncbi:hypothetical protein ACVBBW_004730 [Escherichia coli]|uniref:F4 family fimbrial subunit n=1 Tax=Escherichia coli TaxID=562 RepID=UPI0006BEC0C8|nr:hypothetical protein [Escherichia coli]EFY7012985.1 hypothetical protein [Escherichia coli]EHW2838371.1 hypothetical protein [Escherichia coli]EHX1169778.1 hypothetical protein [Escherichia coli]EHX8966803.1 hypothetical protein [Escherichia coli]EJE3347855.1 hypothetical protein [Escherichia coli]
MKKTLLALAVVSSVAASCPVMASEWQDGMADGHVDFGGTITLSTPVVWQWKVGDGKIDFSSETRQMDSSKQQLDIAVENDIPILLGRMQDAAKGDSFNHGGAKPTIAFTSNGKVITPITNTNGHMILNVDIVDASTSSSKLGSMTINATAAGTAAIMSFDKSDLSISGMYAPSDSVFYGGLPKIMEGSLLNAGVANTLITSLGGESTENLVQKIKNIAGDQGLSVSSSDGYFAADGWIDSSRYYAFAYGMGIKQGDKLTLNFDAPVSQTTQWKAPLGITISYA